MPSILRCETPSISVNSSETDKVMHTTAQPLTRTNSISLLYTALLAIRMVSSICSSVSP